MFARHLASRNHKPSALHLHIQAIGLFYDFLYATRIRTGAAFGSEELVQLITTFIEARRFGTIDREGNDKSGLFWPPDLGGRALNELIKLSRFCTFCSSHFATSEHRHGIELLGRLFATDDAQLGQLNAGLNSRFGLLSHLAPPKLKKRDQPKKEPKDRLAPRSFPSNSIVDLLNQSATIRDKQMWLLGAFGATRLSECLNLFSSDIDWRKSDGARITLAHPALSEVIWVDEFNRERKTTREVYLRDRFGLIPRNQLSATDPLFAGWKGMVYGDFVEPEDQRLGLYRSEIFWLLPAAGILFWRLHEEYERIRIRIGGNHPYYFVNLVGEGVGEPVTIKNVQQIFSRVTARIKVHTRFYHSLRHYYGYFALNHLQVAAADGTSRRLTISEVRVMMRHRSEESTRVYAKPDISQIKASINAASARSNARYSDLALQLERIVM
ncbi:MAG: hypothetical protein Q7J29_11070 [Stagnimonas sp.]|nr:hypothetical protein [Stagnimonas sp.]